MITRFWPIASTTIVAVALFVAMRAGAADEAAACPVAPQERVQLVQTQSTDSAPPLVCCFEGQQDESCTVHSATSAGCEWTLAYQCPGGNYTCDKDTKICRCDPPPAETTTQ